MGVFPAFGAWINQNSQQSLKAPKRSENVESKSVSEMDANNGPAKIKKYYDEDEWERQEQLWRAAEKKNPWYDAPPKVKKQMGGSEISRSEEKSGIGFVKLFENNVVFPGFLVWINQTIQEPLKAEFKRLRNVKELSLNKSVSEIETTHDEHRDDQEKLEKQLQAWRDNPSWIDQPPKVQVKSQNGLFCHLNVEVNVGLPPELVYNIFTHPDNKRYFKNIKENISRKVLIDEGLKQTVEVKQAAAWKFLWWAGTFPIHLIVEENQKNLTSNYKQEKTMFMKVFEGCWKVEPLFIDEHLCERSKPKTREDYHTCSNGQGRIGSKVTMDQMFQPSALLTPPPLSWYIRGITIKTTESMIEDLLTEAARLRGGKGGGHDDDQGQNSVVLEKSKAVDIKERWRSRRRSKGRRYTNVKTMQSTRLCFWNFHDCDIENIIVM